MSGVQGATARRGAGILSMVVMLLAGCVSEAPEPTGPSNGDITIEMTSQLTYAPATVSARVGQTVTWRNSSSMSHTVTADPELAANPGTVLLPAGADPFASDLIPVGGSYSHTFTVPGTYRYFCQPHEGAGMIGVVLVTAAP